VTCYVAVANEKRDAFTFGIRIFDFFRKHQFQTPFSKAKIATEPISNIFLFEGSNQLTNLDLQHNGFDLTCGAVLMPRDSPARLNCR